MSIFTSGVNWIIKNLGLLLELIFLLLPSSPFSSPAAAPDSVNLGWVTWLLDFPTWITHMALLLTAFYVYYGIRVLARWAKVSKN